jgi:hypothetical protein
MCINFDSWTRAREPGGKKDVSVTVAIKIAVGAALTRHGGSNSINVRMLLGPMPTVRPLAQDFFKKDPPFILFSLLILSFLIF